MFREQQSPQQSLHYRDHHKPLAIAEIREKILAQYRETYTEQAHPFGTPPLRRFLDTARHASDLERSHKPRQIAMHLEAIDPATGKIDQRYLTHFEPPFDEDREKEPMRERLGFYMTDPELTAMYKADPRLSKVRKERALQLYSLYKNEELSPEEIIERFKRPLSLSIANDVILTIKSSEGRYKDKPLLKPKVKLPEKGEHTTAAEKRARKMLLYQHYIDLFDNSLPQYFQIVADGSTAMLELKSNVGVVSTTGYTLDGHRPDFVVLETLLFGITTSTPPKVKEAFEAIAASYTEKDKDGKDFWTPGEGFNEDLLVKVNGGLMMQHPLFQYMLLYDQQGNKVTPQHFQNKQYQNHMEAYKRAALGGTELFEEMILEILYQIEHGGAEFQNFSDSQKEIINAVVDVGVETTGRWTRLPGKKASSGYTASGLHDDILYGQALLARAMNSSQTFQN